MLVAQYLDFKGNIKRLYSMKAMLNEPIFLATCNATMTTVKTLQVAEGVARLQFMFACNLQPRPPAKNYLPLDGERALIGSF